METGKAWRVIKVEPKTRLSPSGTPQLVIAVTYTVPERDYTHTLEFPADAASTEAVRAAVEADYTRLEGLYAL